MQHKLHSKPAEKGCPACGASDHLPLSHIPYGERIIKVVVCCHCAIGYQRNPLSSEDLVRYYRRQNVFHSTADGSRQASLIRSRMTFLDSVFREVGNRGGRPLVMDVGCGYGLFLGSLPTSWERIGLELNPQRAASARERYRINVLEQRLEEIELPTAAIDLATAFGLLEHLPNPLQFLLAIRRILKPGGYGVVNVPDLDNPLIAFSRFFSVEHILYFTRSSLTALLARAGFKVVKIGQTVQDYQDIACVFKPNRYRTDTVNPMPPPGEAARIVRAVEEQKRWRSLFLRQALTALGESDIFANLTTTAIYGAGEHTRQLARYLLPVRKIQIFVDSNPDLWGKPFFKGKIYPPDEITSLGVRDILISSRAFEEEIIYFLRQRFGNAINIHRIYGRSMQKEKESSLCKKKI